MKNLLLSLIVLLHLQHCQTQTKSSLDYVWYNYQKQVAIQDYSSQFSAATLPCQTRILSCKMLFQILPPSWSSSGNQILIPKKDLNSFRAFFVSLEGSDMTGEKAEFNVLLQIRNGVISSSPTKRPDTMMQMSDSVKTKKPILNSDIVGLPSLKQVEIILSDGDINNISKLIYDVITSNQQCKAHLRYLSQISKLLKNEINVNNMKLEPIRAEIDELQMRRKMLQKQKSELSKNLSVSEQSLSQQSLLNRKQEEKERRERKYMKLKIISQVFLQQISEIQNQQTSEQEDIKILQEQLLKVELELEYENIVRKNISEELKQLSIQSWNMGETIPKSVISLIAGLQEYQRLGDQAKKQIDEIDREIANLQTRLQQFLRGQSQIDIDIDSIFKSVEQLQTDIKADDSRIGELGELRNIMNGNAMTLQSRIDLLQITCANEE